MTMAKAMTMTMKKKTTTNAVKILHKRYIKGSKKRLESLERERDNLNVAEQIYRLRTLARLSQEELADLVGTTQSVISRLEDADYNGHSLAMLRKLGTALHQRVQVQFVPATASRADV
jgi:ribosome-binding protein aMBF1 (putative translation factor)